MSHLVLIMIAAASYTISHLAISKQSSSTNKKNSPAGKSSGQAKQPSSPIFKTTSTPLSLKGGTDINIMFERINGSHLTVFYLQRGGTDGYSKPINDAIASGQLAEHGFLFADSYLRLDHASDVPRKTSKGYNYRCFPQFTGRDGDPVTLADNLIAAGHLSKILSDPSNNKYKTQYRVSSDNDMTQNPPRSADFILMNEAIAQIINDRYQLEDNATFYGTHPEFARYFFTPNPTYPFVAISQLGYPPGERIETENVTNSDEEST
jgi:hypothetical protein